MACGGDDIVSGLVLAADLEDYSFLKNTNDLIPRAKYSKGKGSPIAVRRSSYPFSGCPILSGSVSAEKWTKHKHPYVEGKAKKKLEAPESYNGLTPPEYKGLQQKAQSCNGGSFRGARNPHLKGSFPLSRVNAWSGAYTCVSRSFRGVGVVFFSPDKISSTGNVAYERESGTVRIATIRAADLILHIPAGHLATVPT